jgi:hypothetical protein
MTSRSTLRTAAILVVGSLILAGLVGVAAAATKHGVTPLSPKNGKTLAVGTAPTFKVRAKGGGTVWIHVCKNAKKNKKGVICFKADIGQAHKKGGVYQWTPKKFDFPGFYQVTPGTYYWQAFRIDCTTNLNDCNKESKVTKFKVG